MAAAPTLVIQLQRMGDLVLSFPLFSWLNALEPDHPVWVVAEPAFYEALVPLAPSVVFFPPQAAPQLRHTRFHRVINLSHRPEAAVLAGSLPSGARLGARSQDGARRVDGVWQLYRASLVHNNRHNRLHWADLNALDLLAELDPAALARSAWPQPRFPAGTGRVGLFVGASEADKRPEPAFWGELAVQLMRRGCHPVFLGGPTETALGAEAARRANLPHANLCGRFTLAELVRFVAELDLLVTPDTGPMHVGAWGGTLTLNLSMGPVNAWETAPFPPGHLVLRPTASCTGCWRCTRTAGGGQPPCKARFVPGRAASLIHSLLRPAPGRSPAPPGLRLMRTSRSPHGLFQLTPVWAELTPPRPRELLDELWRQWFLARLGGPAHNLRAHNLEDAAQALRAGHPHGSELLRAALPRWQAGLAAQMRRPAPAPDFWLQAPPLLRPLTGYLQLYLENADFRREAWLTALEHLEHLAATIR